MASVHIAWRINRIATSMQKLKRISLSMTEQLLTAITPISPLDGRYAQKCRSLAEFVANTGLCGTGLKWR